MNSIARIDAARLRSMASMLVDDDPQDDFDPSAAVLNLRAQTAAEMLADYRAEQEHFQTAPFDDEGQRLRFFRGGVTIWSGFPGSGKTTLLRQFACHLMKRGEHVFFASLEEHPRNLAIGIASVANGVPLKQVPDERQLQRFMDRYHSQLRIWGVLGIAPHRRILGVIRKLAGEGVTAAIVDSLMCLDIRNDDIEAQRQFAVLVAATAKETGVHIHLVAHPKKPMQNGQEPDINDVAGAKEIGGIADNIIFVRRGNPSPGTAAVPMKVMVKKQRYWTGEWPEYEGYFSHEHRQLLPSPVSQRIEYL